GAEQNVYLNTCPQNYKFTGKERDTETGLDEFGARYYNSALGRFTTPDWAARPTTVPYAKFGDPQTLNLYSYVENSPVNQADADGHSGAENDAVHNVHYGLTSGADPEGDQMSLEDAAARAQNTVERQEIGQNQNQQNQNAQA